MGLVTGAGARLLRNAINGSITSGGIRFTGGQRSMKNDYTISSLGYDIGFGRYLSPYEEYSVGITGVVGGSYVNDLIYGSRQNLGIFIDTNEIEYVITYMDNLSINFVLTSTGIGDLYFYWDDSFNEYYLIYTLTIEVY